MRPAMTSPPSGEYGSIQHDEEAPTVVSGTVVTPAHPAIVAVRSLNHQHSLMSLHSHVSEEHAAQDEGTPQKVCVQKFLPPL